MTLQAFLQQFYDQARWRSKLARLLSERASEVLGRPEKITRQRLREYAIGTIKIPYDYLSPLADVLGIASDATKVAELHTAAGYPPPVALLPAANAA
jgi:hypothetical protein